MIAPPTLHVIDSSVWVPVLRRGQQSATLSERVTALVRDGSAAVIGVIRVELLRAARDETDYRSLSSKLEGLIDLSTDSESWAVAAQLGFDLRRAGVLAQLADLVIAGAAIRWNAVLIHRDADFDLIARHSRLRVESHL